jgi:hypothetical protein
VILSWPPQVSCGLPSISLLCRRLRPHFPLPYLGPSVVIAVFAQRPHLGSSGHLMPASASPSSHLRCQIRSGGNSPSVAGSPTLLSAVLLAPIICAPFLGYSQLPYLDLPSNPSTKDFENHPMADWNMILGRTRSSGGTSAGWTRLAEAECSPRKEDRSSRLGQPLLVCAGAWFTRTWVDIV